jgi:NAD(P)-dependent dehydrogenase (short-subunit alcohol dehydrogenase family)
VGAFAFDRSLTPAQKLASTLRHQLAERAAEVDILNVTTMAAEFGMPGLFASGASKAAVALLTRRGRPSTAPRCARQRPVSPGPTTIPGTDAMPICSVGDKVASALLGGRIARKETLDVDLLQRNVLRRSQCHPSRLTMFHMMRLLTARPPL